MLLFLVYHEQFPDWVVLPVFRFPFCSVVPAETVGRIFFSAAAFDPFLSSY